MSNISAMQERLRSEVSAGTKFWFTTDIWTAQNQCQGYMAVTLHYVSSIGDCW